ncbi:glycosyltransferase family 4 protein [Symmachiella dynata]|uniref:glycosyltransferase family 4 protein n=1 Tax=Symmachiella dynata TaxID=2527995 RepID=UPI0030EEF022
MSFEVPTHNKPTVAFGPKLPGIGSWDWVGGDTLQELSKYFEVLSFSADAIPACDVLIIVKYLLPIDVVREIARTRAVIYCPIDYYGSSAEIDRDGCLLSHCARVLLHQLRLRKYFQSYAPVECIEHHTRFVTPSLAEYHESGDILWVGVRTHLPVLREWLLQHRLPGRLRMLTNLEDVAATASLAQFGLDGLGTEITLENWTPQRHLDLVMNARCALDVKGNDFRQRHKPPAKAIDFIAAGLPLAMNPESAAVADLRVRGFEVASPLDPQRWLSREYYEETRQFGQQLRESHSLEQIGRHWKEIIEQVLQERATTGQSESIPEVHIGSQDDRTSVVESPTTCGAEQPVKVAIVSLLFNWPSTGGGNVHTQELVKFLARAGYEVRHYFARFAAWGIGQIRAELSPQHIALDFSDEHWTISGITSAFRQAVDQFSPEHVLITDSWNFKPHLARALSGYRCYLRMQAAECLCPLNNLQILPTPDGGVGRCGNNQLASAPQCQDCLELRGNLSGSLHQVERALSGVGTAEYDEILRQAMRSAQAVLTVNPLIAEQYRPYAQRVEVVMYGMDAARFPPNHRERQLDDVDQGRVRILFAGLTDEWIKGFHVIHEACDRLWRERQDFELVATSDPAGPVDPFTTRIGWKSQEELAALYRDCDICVVPTIVPDGLSRTSVEAMGAGLPVVASDIGGLPYSVIDGVTGLLCRPGDVNEWVRTLTRLIDDPALRQSMGAAGRRQFEERFTWETVIDKQYARLFSDLQVEMPSRIDPANKPRAMTHS